MGHWRGVCLGASLTPSCILPADSTNSSENMYTIMNPMGPGTGRANVSRELRGGGRWRRWPSWRGGGPNPTLRFCSQFPLGPGSEGPMAAMSALEPHHVNGSLGEWVAWTLSSPKPLHEPRAPPGGLPPPLHLCSPWGRLGRVEPPWVVQ